MKSLILTASYLWKDTWKRWFEQPGSILARALITVIMVSISVILLAAFDIQVKKVRTQLESFGLDNLLVIEIVAPIDPAAKASEDRFLRLEQFGDLLTLKKLNQNGKGPDGRLISLITYQDRDIPTLEPYLKYNHEAFFFSTKYQDGLLVDCKIGNKLVRCICLKPAENISRLIKNDTLIVPSKQFKEYESKGYQILYYLKRSADAPAMQNIISSINNTIRSDNNRGQVQIESALKFKAKLENLESQQEVMRFTMAGLLGGSIALIYGTLSVLEFRQSMYIAALLRSFGTSRLLLGIRTVLENLLIANFSAIAVIYTVSLQHEHIFKALKLQTGDIDKTALYWNEEVLWIFIFINIGVVMSSLPVFLAMKKPVGKILS